MKKRVFPMQPDGAGIVFRPLLTPLEAAMLPAKEQRPRNALHHAKAAWQPDKKSGEPKGQRLKIWVR